MLLAAFAVYSMGQPGQGQPPPPQLPPKPQAPNITLPVAPLGVQRGTAIELTLAGANLAEPIALWTSIPGAKATFPTDANNGKDNAKLRVKLEVPKDATMGYHSIRLATSRGMSNFRLFCVDDLPQVLQQETNRDKAKPQAVTVPCVVVGRANAEATDWYKITATANQRLSFEVLGRRLGSAFDPQLTIYDAKTGRELPEGFSNDAPGCQTDPRLTVTFKDAGDYLVAVRDVTYRGGADFYYRLRIGDFPCATTPMPLAIKRGAKASIGFAGPNVDGVPAVEVQAPTDPAVNTIWVTPKGTNGLHGWPVALAVSDIDEVVEQEPNNEPAKANRVPVPGGVSARFQEKGDIDHFVFAAKKGERLVIEAQTQELYSPTEVFMTLKDAKGTQLAATNPMAAARLDFNPPADGDYTLAVEHLLNWGGPAESYRVTITPYTPGFNLQLRLDRWDTVQGGSVSIPVYLSARRDYTGPIEVSVIGPPGITGQATIKNGQPVAPPAPNVPPSVLLPITVKADVPVGGHNLIIQGKATINGKPVVAYASVRHIVSQNMANLPYPPRTMYHQVGLAVTPKPPFTLAAKFDAAEYLRGGPAMATITATRDPGFTEQINVSATGLPPAVAPGLKNIAAGQNEVKVQLNVAANAPIGQFAVSFVGTAKHQGKDVGFTAPPAPLVIALPFTLAVSPAPFKIAQGSKATLKVTATRKGGYQGPIAVELRGLPANVTAPKATIPQGQLSVDIEVSAAANVPLGNKPGLSVFGTATTAANQQGATPFAMIVEPLPPPFELKIEPATFKLMQGGKVKLKVTAIRHGYTGAIEVEVLNLPAKVTAPKAVIAVGQESVEMEVSAAADAALGDKADVQVIGKAIAQSASPKIKVSVEKKQ
jgi:hypothetical protein